MSGYGEIAAIAARPLLIFLLTISTVFGCGQLPQGRERNMSFSVTGFSLPVAMVYFENNGVRSQFPGIAHSQQAATSFVTGLIMQSVNDDLEQEGRNALLLPGVISLILQQLTVQINYDPLKCEVAFDPAGMIDMTKPQNCIIVSNTVTAICDLTMNARSCNTVSSMNAAEM